MIWKYLLSFTRLPFHFVNGFLWLKAFQFDVVPFVYFSFYCSCLTDWFEKILLRLMSKSLLPMVSSQSFLVYGLTFKSLNSFEFIVACSCPTNGLHLQLLLLGWARVSTGTLCMSSVLLGYNGTRFLKITIACHETKINVVAR